MMMNGSSRNADATGGNVAPIGEPCVHEAAVLAAAESALESGPEASVWDETLRAHARSCPSCQEALEVSRYLQTEAQTVATALADDTIPHPGLIWWRRRILDRQAAARRVLWPVTVFPLVAGAVGLVVFAVVAWWEWWMSAGGGRVSASIDVRMLTLLLMVAATLPIGWSIVSALYVRQRK
jgi:hypothetical protein